MRLRSTAGGRLGKLMNLVAEIQKKLRRSSETLKQMREQAKRSSLFRRERYPTYISKMTKWRINVLRRTKFLNQSQKDAMMPKARRLMIKLSRLNLIIERISYFWSLIQGIIILLFLSSSGVLGLRSISMNPWDHWYFWNVSTPNLMANLFIGPILLFLYIFITNDINRIKSPDIRLSKARIELLVSSLGIAILISFSRWISLNSATLLVYILLFGVCGFRLIFYINGILDTLLASLFEVVGYRKVPEAIVAHNILLILGEIEKNPNVLSELEFKKWASTRLDYVAFAINRDIPSFLKTKNTEFNETARQALQKIANSVIEKKLWILTPKGDTSEYLGSYLAIFLLNFVKGDWDLLERLASSRLTLSERWSKRYLPILRTMTFISIPIIAYWLLNILRLINQPWAGNIVGYIILWALINVFWLIDPTAKEKIGSFKDTAGLF